jgi:biopolymer transport protein ExbB
MRGRFWIGVAVTAGVLLGFAGLALAQEDGPAGPAKFSYLDWFVTKGGPIGWLLILIDIASWAVIIEHFISIRRATVLPDPVRGQITDMVDAKQYREVIEYTVAEPSMLSYILHRSLDEAAHGYPAMERAMEEASEERTTKLLRKIELLNVIGNVSPMLGLLGTVYGMIRAFSEIVAAQEMPKPAALADSIGIALVTTFWGLVVAIPALAVYATMRNRIDALSSEAMAASQEILATFRPGAKKKSEAG